MAKDKNIVTKRDGVGAYGLYVDYVIHTPSTGQLLRQERRFLVKNLLCVYSRTRGDKRAAWRVYSYPDHQHARDAFIANLERAKSDVTLIHTPLVVEMSESDMESVAKLEAPYGRFNGSVATERAVGKLDDVTWKAPGY